MRVKLLTIMAGPGGSAGPGDVVDLPDAEAEALIAGGYALDETQKATAVAGQKPAAGKKPGAKADPAP